MIVSVLLSLLASSVPGDVSPAQACRTIADSTARLACYDAHERTEAPAPPAAPVATSVHAVRETPSAPASAVPAAPLASASSATIIRDAPTGRIAAVQRMRYGLFRLTLDDGRMFDTATDRAAPPAVGATVRLRRSVIGTTFLDVPGESPLTVRLVRAPR
jgi:hypothetical protein